jgi:hypothetical protein
MTRNTGIFGQLSTPAIFWTVFLCAFL